MTFSVYRTFSNLNRRRSLGFTLIELLVVIGIISILSAGGVTQFTRAQARSRDARRQSDLEQVRSALELYRADNSTVGYPNPPGSDGTNGKYSNLAAPLTSYINPLPQDPRNTGSTVYTYAGGGTSYTLCAGSLEVTGSNYCVVPP